MYTRAYVRICPEYFKYGTSRADRENTDATKLARGAYEPVINAASHAAIARRMFAVGKERNRYYGGLCGV